MGVLERQQASEPEWRKRVDGRLDEYMERLDKGDERMTSIEGGVQRIEQAVGDILSIVVIFKAFTGFASVLGWIFTGLKWCAGAIIAVGVLYWVAHTGVLPAPEGVTFPVPSHAPR